MINDRLLDLGLNILQTEVTRLDICTADPASFAEATSTYTCGNATGAALPVVNAPSARGAGGREVIIAATNHASAVVTKDDTATHVALSNVANNRLLATKDLATGQVVTSGNTFTLTSFKIEFPGLA